MIALPKAKIKEGLPSPPRSDLTLVQVLSSRVEAGISFLLKGQFAEQPSKKSTVVNTTFAKLGNGPQKARSVRLFMQMM